MNKIVNKAILVVAAAAGLVSCMRDAVPTSIVTSDQASESAMALEGMVGAIPTSMVSLGAASGGKYHWDFGYPAMMLAYDALAGEFVGTSTEDADGYNHFSGWSSNMGNGPLYYPAFLFWGNYFTFIKAANDVIGTLNSGEMTAATMPYMAIAKTYRALYYLDMARAYEPFSPSDSAVENYEIPADIEGFTVPVITEATSESDARNNPRLSRDAMFEFIFEDLNAAEEIYLTEGVKIPTNKVQPGLSVVYGLKARAYLWLGRFGAANYEKAAEYARKAIDLAGAPTTAADWTNPTSGFNTATSSWMWYLPQSSESVNNLLNYAAFLSTEATWGYGNVSAFGIRNVDYDRMGAADIRKSVVVGPEVNYDDYKNVTCCASQEAFEAVMFPYTNLKFRPANGNTSDYTSGNATSVPLMRVDEMYFIEAEAVAHSNPTQGLELLKGFMASRDANYAPKSASTSESAVVEEIIFQKRMEFWGEGVILFDLKRLEAGIHTGYDGTNVCSAHRWDVDGVAPWWNVCIPQIEENQNLALKDKNNPDPTGSVLNWGVTE